MPAWVNNKFGRPKHVTHREEMPVSSHIGRPTADPLLTQFLRIVLNNWVTAYALGHVADPRRQALDSLLRRRRRGNAVCTCCAFNRYRQARLTPSHPECMHRDRPIAIE
jgi:hypothetical protein